MRGKEGRIKGGEDRKKVGRIEGGLEERKDRRQGRRKDGRNEG